MNLFSDRKGLKPARMILQTNSIDDSLRNRLWNAFYGIYIERQKYGYYGEYTEILSRFLRLCWDLYFKSPVDSVPANWVKAHGFLRDYFLRCSWNEVYDFIEFASVNYPDRWAKEEFINSCNTILEAELSGYRFVAGKIIDVTSEDEIQAIENAVTASGPLQPVADHLRRAHSTRNPPATSTLRIL